MRKTVPTTIAELRSNPDATEIYKSSWPSAEVFLFALGNQLFHAQWRGCLDGRTLPWMQAPGDVDETLWNNAEARAARCSQKEFVRPVTPARAARIVINLDLPTELRGVVKIAD